MIKFNVGCGRRNWPGWINVDGNGMDHIHSNDISLKYQPDNYIDLIYSSHLIAYTDQEEFAEILKQWYKKIKPGGTLRIATPDYDRLNWLYHCGVEFDRIVGPLFGRMKMGEEWIYHKYSWGYSNLEAVLLDAGFTNVERYDHHKTCHPNTGNRSDEFDDCSAAYIDKALISLNVQATKPL